ncbi:MAG TPA: hypothetical protein PLN69_05490 [bacterium]|nr:hypothetical protein [bacterium]
MKQILKIIFIVCLPVFIVSSCVKDKYPHASGILEQLHYDPVQEETYVEPFIVEKKDAEYTVSPLYEYDLYGLVVSYHHSDSILDYYHKLWGDTLNIKDLCVLWGNNLKTDLFREIKFKNANWTCYFNTRSNEAWSNFHLNEVSNNHLLSDDKKISKKIMKARRGDQIHFHGYLSEYSNDKGFRRGTSISREDTMGGACETVYVTEFEILKSSNPTWDFINTTTRYLLIVSVILLIIIFFLEAAQSSRQAFKDEK